MYVDGKMVPVETIPGMGKRGMRENGVLVCLGWGKFKYDIFVIRTFVNATRYFHPAQQFKKP
jgi:hypothetical protein